MSSFLDKAGLITLWEIIDGKFENLQIRRDNDFNYDDTWVPKKGEMCFVDTATSGLRAKIGDGITQFQNLQYIDAQNNIIELGYLKDNQFYYESSYTNTIEAYKNKIYIEQSTGKLYFFNGTEYVMINKDLNNASEDTAGVLKSYSTVGDNTDGTINQKAITQELNKKAEVSMDAESETLTIL